MKRLFLFFSLCALMGCPSPKDETKPAPTVATTVDPAPSCSGESCSLPTTLTTKLAEDNWEVTVPANWHKLTPPENGVTLFVMEENKKALFVLVKEKFTGAYGDYVLSSLRGLKNQGGVFNNAHQLTINDNKYVMVESDLHKADGSTVKLWMWVTAKNGYGYSFTCGGVESFPQAKDVCASIASSLKIN